jgi:hypothetical protein
MMNGYYQENLEFTNKCGIISRESLTTKKISDERKIMKMITPRGLVKGAERSKGLPLGSLEKRYARIRDKVNNTPARNLPTKPMRFSARPLQGELDPKKIQFK